MSLSELWNSSKEQLQDKHVQQIITFAGDGQLRDGSPASKEFRDFLSTIPSSILKRYSENCLNDKFNESGLALQDVVNQVGKRLDFDVTEGRYRGVRGAIGFDGLWRFPDGHSVVVEVKTTDAYRISLDNIAGYRKALIEAEQIDKERSSILIIVGRQDTGDLEAQIRGSRHAWDVRLISIDALLRLMFLKENLDDPVIIQRIYDLLVPREYTKLDEIVDIVFSATEEAKQEESLDDPTQEEKQTETKERSVPVAFHQACIAQVEKELSRSVIKRTRTKYLTVDNELAIICAVSKTHTLADHNSYWFAFHPHQKEFLEGATDKFVVLGCGSPDIVLLIPFSNINKWLDELWTTENENRMYWHIRIHEYDNKLLLDRKGGQSRIDITNFRLS